MVRSGSIRLLFALSLMLGFGLSAASSARAQSSQATVVAHAVDKSGAALTGACYVFASASLASGAQPVCDGDDGAEDGAATLVLTSIGDYDRLVMTAAPASYLVGQQQPFKVVDGGTAAVSFTLAKGGGQATIAYVDEKGSALAGGSIRIYSINAVGRAGSVVAAAAVGKQGSAEVAGLPDGNYYVSTIPPRKHALANGPTPVFSIANAGSASVTIPFERTGTVQLKVTLLDPTVMTCFKLVNVDDLSVSGQAGCAGGGFGDGPIAIENVRYGTYSVQPASGWPLHTAMPDKAVIVKVKNSKTAKASVVLKEGGQGIAVSLASPGGAEPESPCVAVYTDAAAPVLAAFKCAASTVWLASPGKYLVQANAGGDGTALRSPVTPITVTAGQTAKLKLELRKAADLTLMARDVNQKPIEGACFMAASAAHSALLVVGAIGCDEDDGARDGAVTFKEMTAGTEYAVFPLVLKDGVVMPAAQTIALEEGGATVTFDAVKTGGANLNVRRVDAGGKAVLRACFALYASANGERGALQTIRCDGHDPAGSDGVTHFAGVAAGDYVLADVSAPGETALAPDRIVTMTAEEQDVDFGPAPPAAASPAASPAAGG